MDNLIINYDLSKVGKLEWKTIPEFGAEDITISLRRNLWESYVSIFFAEDDLRLSITDSIKYAILDGQQDLDHPETRVYSDPIEKEMFADAFWAQKL
jgi:superfamily I DNA and/or RNA helicase